MKKFVNGLMQFKTAACFAFTAQIMIFLIVGLFTGQQSISHAAVLQSMGIAVAISLLQWIFFTETFIKRMSYALRVVVFTLLLYPMLLGCAVAFQWFPITSSSWGALMLFSAIFLAILLILLLVFQIYFRVSGNRYNESLNAYKKRQDGQDQ